MSRVRRGKISVSEKETVVYAVTAADSGAPDDSREKRKKDATEPLYLKRI
ncbi:MAG: hypothetical protein QXV09_03795 [Candidatus Bathyarchaeia archaeon]